MDERTKTVFGGDDSGGWPPELVKNRVKDEVERGGMRVRE